MTHEVQNFNRSQIEDLLPHRGAFLFLTEASVTGQSGNANVAWDAGTHQLQGHFPGMPIVPGVFLIEAAAQLIGVVMASQAAKNDPRLGMLAGVRKALIQRPVVPGQTVNFQAMLGRAMNEIFYMATATVTDLQQNRIASLELIIAIVDKQELNLPMQKVA